MKYISLFILFLFLSVGCSGQNEGSSLPDLEGEVVEVSDQSLIVQIKVAKDLTDYEGSIFKVNIENIIKSDFEVGDYIKIWLEEGTAFEDLEPIYVIAERIELVANG